MFVCACVGYNHGAFSKPRRCIGGLLRVVAVVWRCLPKSASEFTSLTEGQVSLRQELMMRFEAVCAALAIGCIAVCALPATEAHADDVKWVKASNGEVPPGAFVGGQEPGRKLYVCRAEYKGGVYPGKVVGKNCNIGWGGKEITVNTYEVLVPGSVKLTWGLGVEGSVEKGAIKGGSASGRDLYICRVEYKGGVHPGKVAADGCYITWGGKEYSFHVHYDALERIP